VCGRAKAGVMAGRADRRQSAEGRIDTVTDWQWAVAEAPALTRLLSSVTALHDMGHGSQTGCRAHRRERESGRAAIVK
jgi:hypothetical protein